jgi:hypothetical protein
VVGSARSLAQSSQLGEVGQLCMHACITHQAGEESGKQLKGPRSFSFSQLLRIVRLVLVVVYGSKKMFCMDTGRHNFIAFPLFQRRGITSIEYGVHFCGIVPCRVRTAVKQYFPAAPHPRWWSFSGNKEERPAVTFTYCNLYSALRTRYSVGTYSVCTPYFKSSNVPLHAKDR